MALVQVVQGHADLCHEELHRRLRDAHSGHKIEEVSPGHEIHDEKQLVVSLEGVMQSDDERVVDLGEHKLLSPDPQGAVLASNALLLDHLHGKDTPCCFLENLVNFANTTCPNHVHDLELVKDALPLGGPSLEPAFEALRTHTHFSEVIHLRNLDPCAATPPTEYSPTHTAVMSTVEEVELPLAACTLWGLSILHPHGTDEGGWLECSVLPPRGVLPWFILVLTAPVCTITSGCNGIMKCHVCVATSTS
mmetsp:Transcript_130095/g.224890  ORF Transcript_130095/g.224890 Transcript_130095/m.224890 type:complete len:249 (-) Transcript_130095:513-1259(-)